MPGALGDGSAAIAVSSRPATAKMITPSRKAPITPPQALRQRRGARLSVGMTSSTGTSSTSGATMRGTSAQPSSPPTSKNAQKMVSTTTAR